MYVLSSLEICSLTLLKNFSKIKKKKKKNYELKIIRKKKKKKKKLVVWI